MDRIRWLIRRDRRLFLGMFLLFFVGVVLGEILPMVDPDSSKALTKLVLEKFGEMAQNLKGAPVSTQIFTIWANNLTVSITAAVVGSLIPIAPLFFLMGNGIVIGLFQSYTQVHTGIAPLQYYLSLAPHGVFEIPAFIIAMGVAFRLGSIPYRLVWHYYHRKEYRPLFREFFNDFPYYAALIFGLFTVAAVIEMGLSPYIMKLFQ